jgi:hypothetical protein
MWGPGSTVFGEYRGIESIIHPSYLPLAGAAREMVRVYLSTAPSELSGKDAYGAQISPKALITRIAAVSANPLGACLAETVEVARLRPAR